jgi:ABC-type polysaccharide/polyol phosphate transport system ATPase subunit
MSRIIDFSEIGEFVDAPVRTYSTGMRMRLAFAAAISVDPDVLLLDEVLAVGDEVFARKCYACIDDFRARNKTIVLVTHAAEIVAQRCQNALWLDGGRVVAFGNAADVVAAYHAGLPPAPSPPEELAAVGGAL